MTNREVTDSKLLSIRQIANDALISVNKLIEDGDSHALFQSAENLCSQAHDIYRLCVILQTMDDMGNLTGKEQSND